MIARILDRPSAIRSLRILMLVALIAMVAWSAARHVTFLVAAENWLLDYRAAAFSPPLPPEDRIVVLAITEDTLATLPQRSPIDRKFLAEMIATLRQKGPQTIGIDLLFDRPTEPKADAALRAALRAEGASIVVAVTGRNDGLLPEQLEFQTKFLDGLATGSVAIAVDAVDGVARRLPENGLAAALAQSLGAVLPGPGELIAWRGSPAGNPPPFRVYPAESLAALPDAWIRSRIALIGVDLPGADRYPTPFRTTLDSARGMQPGVILHAHVLSQMLDGRRIASAGWAADLVLTLLFSAIGAAVAAAPWRAGTKVGLVLLSGTVALAGSAAAFRLTGLVVPVAAPALAILASVGIGSAWLFRAELERRRFIEGAFRHFLAPSYIERLIAEPQLLRVGGERRELTVLFTDVTGFTALTERTDPETFVPMLNGYLGGICRIVLDHGGTIDKIVGDAIHAFFGAPVPEPDHAARAVRCALALAAFGDDFVRRQADLDREFGATRIGVQTGPVILGNFGGAERWDYTAYGDAVNVAVRLESANSTIGTRICIGHETAAQCPGMRFRPIGRVCLKGKVREVGVFEPMPDDSDPSDLAAYADAYDLMAKGDRAAEAAFAVLAERRPHDKLVAFHLARCRTGDVSCTIAMDVK